MPISLSLYLERERERETGTCLGLVRDAPLGRLPPSLVATYVECPCRWQAFLTGSDGSAAYGRCGLLASPDARMAAGDIGCRPVRWRFDVLPRSFSARRLHGVEKGGSSRPVPLA